MFIKLCKLSADDIVNGNLYDVTDLLADGV